MADGAFTPGTGTLKSTNLIAAFIENAMLIQAEEREAALNTDAITAAGLTVPDNIVLTPDFNADTFTVSVPALPTSTSYSSGNTVISPVDYLEPINAIVPAVDHTLVITGTGLTNASKVKSLYQLAQLIQEDEKVKGDNVLSMVHDTDNDTVAINATFTGTPKVNISGKPEFEADNYLIVV